MHLLKNEKLRSWLDRHPFVRWLLTLRGHPRAIAAGIALGVFLAFTPTIGIQIVLGTVIATLFNFNRLAVFGAVWVTNPLTAVPIYSFTYWIGSWFRPGPDVYQVKQLLSDVFTRMASFNFLQIKKIVLHTLSIGWDIFIPMWIGGFILGGIFAGLSYLLTLKMVVVFRKRQQQQSAASS